MSRLTDHDYLVHRLYLYEQWFDHGGGTLDQIPTAQQRDLHDYYAPSEPLSDAEALAHRRAMTAAFPSLPHKAGRAYEALHASLTGAPNLILERHRVASKASAAKHGQSRGAIRIVALARPKLDVDRAAQALLKLIQADIDGERRRRAEAMSRRRKH